MKQQRPAKPSQPNLAAPAADNTRDQLVLTAIDQIEQHGLDKLTVRGIAAAAEANVAAVNYHFRSKDALVAAALERSILNMLQDTETILNKLPAKPAAVLSELFAYYLEGALRYPRVSKAHLHDAFCSDDYTGAFPRLFAPVTERLTSVVQQSVRGLNQASAGRRVIAALSAVFFPVFFPGLYATLHALDTPGARLAYVSDLARTLLSPVAATDKVPR
jgi:AcrR family transcriptional regulator